MSAPAVLAVRLPNPVGDAVAATAVLVALRRGLPDTRILAVGPARLGPLLDGLLAVDRFVPLGGPGTRGGLRAEARALRALGAGAILILPNSWSSALAAWMAGLPRRVGRRARGRGWLLTDRLPPVGPPRPMVTLYQDMLPFLGVQAGDERPRLAVTARQQDQAEGRLADGAGAARGWLGVAPGAAFGPSKVYPLDLAADAVARIREETGLTPLILGGPGEEGLMEELARRLGPPVLSTAAPPADLGELKALLARCAGLLSMDTGAAHVAAALGVPRAVLYGPTDPRWSAGAGEGAVVLHRKDLDCSPCHLKRCPIGHGCLRGLPPSEVAAAMLQALNTGGGGA